MTNTDTQNWKWLKIIDYKDFTLWDTKTYFDIKLQITSKYEIVKLSYFLTDLTKKRMMVLNDELEYQEPTISSKTNTISIRKIGKGKDFKVKSRVMIQPNDLVMARLHTQNGLYAFADKEYFATNTFIPFFIDEHIVNKDFLFITLKPVLTQLQKFDSVGRETYVVQDIFNLQIPLPALSVQNDLVKAYQSKISQAQEAEQKAKALEQSIETYLLEALGIEMETKKQNQNLQQKNLQGLKDLEGLNNNENKYKFLKFVELKDISRWDIDFLTNQSIGIFSVLKKAKYKSKSLREIYNFVSRSWAKQKHQTETFSYIEIGSVDASLGITDFTEIEVKNAPSRATQVVKENDLILGLTRPYLKKFSLISDEYNDFICSSGFQVIAPSEEYNLQFLLEFLKSEAGVKQFEFYMTGALYPAITTKQLQEIQIPLPSLSIQNEIVTHIETQKAAIKRLRAEAVALRASAKGDFEGEIFN